MYARSSSTASRPPVASAVQSPAPTVAGTRYNNAGLPALQYSFAANEFVRAGQPALLYLVPSIVGAGLCTALATGGREAVDELLAYKEPAPDYTRAR